MLSALIKKNLHSNYRIRYRVPLEPVPHTVDSQKLGFPQGWLEKILAPAGWHLTQYPSFSPSLTTSLNTFHYVSHDKKSNEHAPNHF